MPIANTQKICYTIGAKEVRANEKLREDDPNGLVATHGQEVRESHGLQGERENSI